MIVSFRSLHDCLCYNFTRFSFFAVYTIFVLIFFCFPLIKNRSQKPYGLKKSCLAIGLLYGSTGILLSSNTLLLIYGVLYPASITTASISGFFSMSLSYNPSNATLSLTLPELTVTSITYPFFSQPVCAVYAKHFLCSSL